MTAQLPTAFVTKKSLILSQLSIPVSEYDDLSPKGSIDVGIRDLIDEINGADGWVTTSSCAGRVSVFLEGSQTIKKSSKGVEDGAVGEDVGGDMDGVDEGGVRETTAKIGGKGGGGRWLFVSHDPVILEQEEGKSLAAMLEMVPFEEERSTRDINVLEKRFVHFKFEPMILHILTASLSHAQTILSAALQAGFRESGALNLIPSPSGDTMPMVAVRSMGLAIESLIGILDAEDRVVSTVNEATLKTLLDIGNQRFQENEKRIQRFRELLKERLGKEVRKGDGGGEWEDGKARAERKRREGLERKEKLGKESEGRGKSEVDKFEGLNIGDSLN